MRYDAEHKERTRALLLKEAGKAIRTKGPQRIGVAEIMGKAGLTHGGFYAHFKSKDDLVAETIRAMFDELLARLDKSLREPPPADALAGYVRFYLSPKHRDDRARGCPIASLSADAPNLPAPARRAFAAGVSALTQLLGELIEQSGLPDSRQAAASMIAELSGALALARCLGSGEQSDALMAASRASLSQRLGLDQAA